MIKRNLYLLTVLFFVSFSQSKYSPSESEAISNSKEVTNETLDRSVDTIHWMSPNEFNVTSFLKAVALKENDTLFSVITMVNEFPDSWVKSSDIDTLLSLIKSTKKCSCFLNPLSSFIPTNQNAEIGGYAIIFINSFREKKKIDFGLYKCPRTDTKSVEEIEEWKRSLER